MSTDHSDIIGSIYEAAVLPERWPAVLDRLCAISGAWGGALVAVDNAQRTRFTTTDSYRAPFEDLAKSGRTYSNTRTERFLAARYSGFSRDLDFCTQDELDVDAVYRTLLHPHGLNWTMGSVITMPTEDVLVFDFVHRKIDGPFEQEAVAALNPFRPHLARAGLLSTRLRLERARQAIETLAMIGLPGAVLTAAGKVMACNGMFEALAPRISVGARDVLGMLDGRALSIVQNSLAAVTSDEAPSIRSIPVAMTGEMPALIIHLVPIRRSAHDIFIGSNCLMMVTPVLAPDAPLTEMLNGLFDLTPAEARLAKALASGSTKSDFAAGAGISTETVKTQLKSVFEKTGVSRQADLVRLLASTSPLRGAN
ncbi:helix-turn-helix transcriptional regulator [Devosia sp.]|uniref:helix-turn-helix transcriptional regulator n=1 Tax=Devosia sp. TaxID=1871048 RepID=UPI0032650A98